MRGGKSEGAALKCDFIYLIFSAIFMRLLVVGCRKYVYAFMDCFEWLISKDYKL